LHINEGKVETIYPGIFNDRFKPSADSADKILFVGNLEPFKGVHILLQAFKLLSEHFNDLKLILVGKGSLESEVTKLKNSGLSIDCTVYVAHSNLASIYSNCSIFCSPSLKVKKAGIITTVQEQFGFALIEAMASSLPIISSNIGTISEILGPENLVVLPNVESIHGALYKLLTCDKLRKSLKDKNRKRCMSTFNALTQSILFEKAISV
jgi:glycosyltransferase involved in cell wall biosynthesis